MRFAEQTVAGIDISQESISIVLLKNGKNGPKLVKSAVAPMPAGAVKDGGIVRCCAASEDIAGDEVSQQDMDKPCGRFAFCQTCCYADYRDTKADAAQPDPVYPWGDEALCRYAERRYRA